MTTTTGHDLPTSGDDGDDTSVAATTAGDPAPSERVEDTVGAANRVTDGDTVVSPARFAHFVIRCAHFDETRQWYETVLGARTVHLNPMLAFLTYDDEHHRVALVNTPEAPPPAPGSTGLEHVSYTFRTLGELLGTYQRLRRADITPVWCVNHGPTTSIYYRDPEGHQVELQVDNFPDADTLLAWMTSGEFAANPIGVMFDPDDLVARYEAGEPIADLVRRPDTSS